MRVFLLLLVLAHQAVAECPPNPDISDAEAEALTHLRNAPDPIAARGIGLTLWELWIQAPDQAAQDLLDEGMSRRRAYDFAGAARALDALIDYCPGYAEGLNQRAFVAFLQGDMALSLELVDRALVIRPVHLGALSGKVLTLIELGRDDEAQKVLRRALRLNPWLPERRFLRTAPGDSL